jgi:tetratricopeptide (TPR) repeat protein
VLNEQGHWAESLEVADRALKMQRAKLPPDDLQLTPTLLGRAIALNRLERLDEAAQVYDETLAIFERAGAKTNDMAITLYNRGQLEIKRGRLDRALRDYVRAAALMEEVLGTNANRLIWPLVGQARCLIRLGRPAEAIPLLERALKLPTIPDDSSEVIYGKYYLGRARVETRRDIAGGLAMVRAARAEMAPDPWSADILRELDAWLAAHR